jgi:tRNA threonylcarbamoyladenosine biosynthesis protein TsaE
MITEIESDSSKATEELASHIGERLKGGEVIELTSDLGGGKTTFVRGLAKGVGSKDNVASPTFTISRLYKGSSLDIHHFDFYRLSEAGLMAEELAELISDPKNIIVVEWSEIVKDILPSERLTINFKIINDRKRKLQFTCPESLKYLIKGLEP